VERLPSENRLKSLYIGRGKSAFEISREFGCSEHKVNYWLRKYNIPKRSIADAMYRKNNPDGDPFRLKKIKTLEDAKLCGLGLGLYWGEGNKKNKNSIRLGNTDPKLIKKFLDFLVKILGISKNKLKFGLQIFSDMPSNKTLNFWLNNLSKYGINKRQFFKTTVTPSRSLGNYREKSKYGVLTVHFCNTKLKKIIDNMLPK
jgi:hypothetical protein